MSLSYTCDSCGAEISRDDLRLSRALVYQGQHYCAGCKGPIVAFLNKMSGHARGGQDAGAREPPGDAPATEAAPAAPVEAPPPSPAEEAPARPAAAPGPPRAPARAPGAAGKPPARPAAAAPPPARPRAARPGSARPAVPGRPARPAKAKGLRGPARSPAPGAPAGGRRAAPGRPAPAPRPATGNPLERRARGGVPAAPRAGRETRGGAGGVAARGRRPLASRGLARRGRAGPPGDEGEPHLRRPSRAPLAIGIAVGAVVLVGGGIFAAFTLGGGTAAPGPNAGETTTPVPEVVSPGPADGGAPAVEPSVALEERQQRLVDDLRQKFREKRNDPDGILGFQSELLMVQQPSLLPSIRAELASLSSEVEARKNALAKELYDKRVAESEALREERSYGAAHDLWKETPRIIEQSPLLAGWQQQERRSRKYSEAAAYFSKLVQKADKYVKQDDTAIAIAILEENVPAKWELEFDRIWEDCRELVRKIRDEEAEELWRESEIARKEREAEERRLQEERDRIRTHRWEKIKDVIDWEPLLSGGGDLENWFMTVDYNVIERGADPFPWKNARIGDEQILSADTRGREGDIFIGMNGNRWVDWALEFEVQVLEGSLHLETRTTIQSFFGSPQIRDKAPEDFVFEAGEYGNWKRVRLEVFGPLVRWIEDGQIKKELRTEHDRGGFRFVLKEKSACQIKDIQHKLVTALEPGKERESQFGDEDEEDY